MASPLVDIEFAHIDLAPLDLAIEEQEVSESAILARHLIEELNHAHISWTTSVLIDDKRVERRSYDIDEALQRVARLIGPVPIHRALMERYLTELKRDFLALFDRRRSAAIEADFLRYQVSREGRLGCSQDIAIWTTVRLGMLSAQLVTERLPASARFGYTRESSPDILVSIIPERYRSFEERAADEYLKGLDRGVVLRRLVHLYVTRASGRRSSSAPNEVDETVRIVGERLAHLASQGE